MQLKVEFECVWVNIHDVLNYNLIIKFKVKFLHVHLTGNNNQNCYHFMSHVFIIRNLRTKFQIGIILIFDFRLSKEEKLTCMITWTAYVNECWRILCVLCNTESEAIEDIENFSLIHFSMILFLHTLQIGTRLFFSFI